MVNHPHDCPVCDEGGECHLQDMTVMTGHDYRRYRFTKRTHRNQDLGPFVNHEMNRCIQCYRCVRFYRDYAGGRDFDVFGCHDDVYFGRHSDGALENEFSGQPRRGLPDRRLRRQDAEAPLHAQVGSADRRRRSACTAPSAATPSRASATASCGASATATTSEVNGYFLCDRGRFGYEFVNSAGARSRAARARARQERRSGGDDGAAVRQRLAQLLRAAVAHRRHRLAARVARGQLRAADARRRRIASVWACRERERRLLLLALALLRDGRARRRACTTSRPPMPRSCSART